MTTEEAIEAFLSKHSNDEQVPHSEAYQMLFEELGDQLLPGLFSLLKSPTPEIRGTAINLLSIRRPHEAHVAAAIAPLIRDADGFVMLTATDRLAEFPQEMVQPFLDDAYQMALEHLTSCPLSLQYVYASGAISRPSKKPCCHGSSPCWMPMKEGSSKSCFS